MSRYIKAEYLTDTIGAMIGYGTTPTDIWDMVSNAPSIDIVRCKECKHRHTPDCFRAYLEYDIQEWVVDSGDDDDFCSYGEREGE